MLATGCGSGGARLLKPPAQGRVPIAVEHLGEGRIRARSAGRKLDLDLSRDISGCTGRTYDRTVNEEYESVVDFEIVDETEKDSYVYMLLLASAPPNCNIQGRCGAGDPDATLIWLKLTEDLSLAGKQGFVIEDCRAGRYTNITREGELSPIRSKDLPWTDDVLQIEFEELEDGSTQRLIYDRRKPEAGLQGRSGDLPVFRGHPVGQEAEGQLTVEVP